MTNVKFIIVLALQCLNAVMLCAQVGVSGRVIDPDNAAVPGIEIRLEADGRPAAVTTTDTNGAFRFSDISSGRYFVHVAESGGFADFIKQITVGAGVTTINVPLRLADVAQNVSVVPGPSELSLDGDNNRDQINTDAKLMGSVPVFDQDYITALVPFLDQTGLATSGVRIVVDGVEMKGTGISASAIAEARINNDPYSVETSRPGKGRLEIITKPGTPQLHGNLNFTFRDSVTDAKNHFASVKPFEQKRIYEGSITGPAATDHHATFLISGSRSEDNLQSVVHALTPSGVINANVPSPIHGIEFAARVARDFSPSHRVSLQYNVSDIVTRNQGVGGLVLASAGVNTQS